MSARIEINNLVRDFVQGLYGNRIWMATPEFLEAFKLFNQLVLSSRENDSTVQFAAIEMGGAQGQGDAVYLGIDPTETNRQVREAAPDSPIRPLWRGANGFVLMEKHVEELEAMLSQLARDTAGPQFEVRDGKILLLVKAFDSQGNMKELESTVKIMADLRAKGYPVGIEIAIPYSKGVGVDPNRPDFNPYPDELYEKKVHDAVKLLKKYNIPSQDCVIGLKDMIGELNAEDATRLVPKMIAAIREEGADIKLGLHLHDTGLALGAYVAATKICQEQNWPITIDSVDGQNTGFVNTTKLIDSLEEAGIETGITAEQRELMQRMEALTNKAANDNFVRRANLALSGEDLRRYKIPGGGFASYDTAVMTNKLVKIGGKDLTLVDALDLSPDEALHVGGHALMAVARLMGEPFAVTPGFQNKQHAALHLLGNMIKDGYLKKDMGADAIMEKLLVPLNDEQVQKYFVDGLSKIDKGVVSNYIEKNEMPVSPHPVVQKAFPLKKDGVLTDGVQSKLEETIRTVKELQEEGLVRPTSSQARVALKLLEKEGLVEARSFASICETLVERGILSERPTGTPMEWRDAAMKEVKFLQDEGLVAAGAENCTKLVNALAEQAFNAAVSYATIKNAGEFADFMRHPHKREPAPSKSDSVGEYNRAILKYKAGVAPDPDIAEKIRLKFLAGENDIDTAHEQVATLIHREWHGIKATVIDYISENAEKIAAAAEYAMRSQGVGEIPDANAKGLEDALKELTEKFYKQQKAAFTAKIQERGEQFLYQESERIDIACAFLKEAIVEISGIEEGNKKAATDAVGKVINSTIDRVESVRVVMPLTGNIVEVFVAEGQEVDKGDVLFTAEAMKMMIPVVAKHDGIVKNLSLKVGMTIKGGEKVIDFKPSDIAQEVADSAPAEFTLSRLSAANASSHADGMRESCLAEIASLDSAIKAIDEQVSTPVKKPEKPEPGDLNARGYNVPYNLDVSDEAKNSDVATKYTHVVINRGGCASKIVGDLEQAGCTDVKVFHTRGDASTPVIENARPDQKVEINGYRDQTRIINALRELYEETGKPIILHPGWGFLSENAGFVERLENELKDKVFFAGPPSKPMKAAGSKVEFRRRSTEKAPWANPKSDPIEDHRTGFSLNELESYVLGGFSRTHPVDSIYRKHFDIVTEPEGDSKVLCERGMAGDVFAKADAGGGGKGIVAFRYDPMATREENYRSYLNKLLGVRKEAKEAWDSGILNVEKRQRGNLHHIEIQFFAANGEGLNLGLRDCTAQSSGQKLNEMNVISGDYPQELNDKINEYAKLEIERQAEEGYRGAGTLEMLVNTKTGDVCFLEINTRIQVEHAVTERDIFEKTGKHISIPVLNAHSAVSEKGAAEILHDVFGMTRDEIEKLKIPGTTRVEQFRVNAKVIDVADGSVTPMPYSDAMLSPATATAIAEETGAMLIHGGAGDGKGDPQIGAIVGTHEEAVAAAKRLEKAHEIVAVCDRLPNAIALPAKEMHGVIFRGDGRINPAFTIATVDAMLEGVVAGNVQLAAGIDTHRPFWPGVRDIAAGAFERAMSVVSVGALPPPVIPSGVGRA